MSSSSVHVQLIPFIAMVCEGQGVIPYCLKLIGATNPQKSDPETIRGDLAIIVVRNIIHGSDGPETAKDEIDLWSKLAVFLCFFQSSPSAFNIPSPRSTST